MNAMLLLVGIANLIGLGFVVTLLRKSHDGKNMGGALREEFSLSRREFAEANKDLRQEVTGGITQTRESLDKRLEQLRDKNDEKLEQIRKTVEGRLETLQKDNADKLEKMRATVDEKLQSTLEKRLSQSFKLVSERLEQVQRGLGEMQGLASDVSDFKRVLTNVKTRGTWGEVQLENLLEQVFIKDHYDKQVMLGTGSRDAVDFAIKLPDKSSKSGFIYLPIDAKFPLEDYQRLVAAQEKGSVTDAELAHKALVNRIKLEAKSIKEKYIQPPKTTDFAVLYVPTESLYAEVLRTPGLFEQLQSTYRVTIAGPTTIAAILSSYQLGFRTLAIAEQTSQVWELLTVIKGEFGKFGDLLDKTREKLVQATNTIDTASRKSRTIESKLGKVQKLADKTADTAGENVSLLDD
ncbi:MAG TPA: DNA recombination protein RmuC [Candidatus Saccharimonadales bacterium]|nr:DNA recombination protein RmuC [Candidatus Saccharimonadales bacterium]